MFLSFPNGSASKKKKTKKQTLPAMPETQETRFDPGLEAPLEEETATHCSTCLSPSATSDSLNPGLRRGGQILHNLSYRAHAHGRRSLGGYRAWGHERVGHAWTKSHTTSVSYLSPQLAAVCHTHPRKPLRISY